MEDILTIAGKEVEEIIIDSISGAVYTQKEYWELIKALLDE